MFQIRINAVCGGATSNQWRQCEIAGCPDCGVDAIDFRRRYGLPAAPSNVITLPDCHFESEEVCRTLELDHEADCFSKDWLSYDVPIPPAIVAAYVDQQTPETAGALFREAIKHRLRVAAEAVAQQEFEQRAKEYMAPEIARLKKQIDELDRCLTEQDNDNERITQRAADMYGCDDVQILENDVDATPDEGYWVGARVWVPRKEQQEEVTGESDHE